jgi:peptidyl-prolyl cis-trans isomerase D
MLSLMRKHATSWLIKIILGAIVIVFVLWGVGSWTSQRSGMVATVNGEMITAEDYRVAYKRLIEQVRQNFGNNLNDELIKTLQLDKQALNQLIDKILMRQAASELDLRVSDQELSQSIRSISAFQTTGVFDPRRYQGVLDRNDWTPEAFEISQRDALLMDKLNNLIAGSVKVSDQEAMEWYMWNDAMVNLDFFLLETDRYTDITVTAEEIQKYFESRKESYKTEPALQVRYIKFEPKTWISQVDISEEEIQEYYDDHPNEFQNPKTVEARHILIEVDQDADTEKVAEAKKRIEDILQKARAEQDFAELAKQYSEGPSKDKGGYLGTFEREAMVKPFADKAFNMKSGEISDPVRTRFGWHLIKVEKVNEATTTPLTGAKDDIRKKLADERAKLLAYDAAESVFDAAFEGRPLEEIAADQKLSVYTTDFFTRQGPSKGVQDRAGFAKVAFDLPEDQVSEIQDLGDGYYLLEIVEKQAARIPELADVEQKVKADLIKEKKDEKAKMDAEALLSALKDGVAIETAGKEFDLTPNSTGFFKRNDSIPNIGFERELSRAAFELSDESSLPQEVFQGSKGFYVIKFKQRKTPPMEEFEKEKANIKERLLQQKRSGTLRAWLEQKKNSSEIVVEEGFLNS